MLSQYETDHFIELGSLVKLGWRECEHDGRPALSFPTSTGTRWRFMDGIKPKYDQAYGYQACWYGLKRAVERAKRLNLDFLIDCNGAASTIAADQHEFPAYSQQSGEGTRPRPELIDELKSVWSGRIIVAFDCDDAGRAGAMKRVQVYQDAGIEAIAIDLGLSIEGGDLADYVSTHTLDDLLKCPHLHVPQSERATPRQHSATTFGDWEKALREIKDRLSCYDFMTQRYGDPKSKSSKYGHWLAPQRIENTPSFCAYQGDGGWFDYGSGGEGGDIFDLIQIVDGCTFTQAVNAAAKLTNVTLPERVSLSLKNEPKADWSKHLSIGERGVTYRYLDAVSAAIIDRWASSDMANEAVDVDYLACITGLTERKIRLAMNRLPVIFLTFDLAYIDLTGKKIQESVEDNLLSYTNLSSISCESEFHHRKSGRPRKLYKLCDRSTFHETVLKVAMPQVVKAAFPKKDPLAAPVQAAFLVELGLDEDEAEVKALELEKRYAKEIAAQIGFKERMQEVRKTIFILKLMLTGEMRPTNDKPHPSTLYADLPIEAKLDKRIDLLATSARTLFKTLGGQVQLSRLVLCSLIGCRDTELASVCKVANIQMKKYVYVKRPVVNLPALLAIPIKLDETIGGFPIDVSSTQDKHPMKMTAPNLKRWATDQIIAQGKLTVRYRCANVYVLDPEPVIVPAPEPEQPKIVQKPLAWIGPFERLFKATLVFGVVLRVLSGLYRLLSFVLCMLADARRKAEKLLSYGEAWVKKTLVVATPWQPHNDKAWRDEDMWRDTSTGEARPYSVQLSLDVLLDSGPSPG